MEHDLELLPVINKIDLPAADVERAREEIDADLGLDSFAAIPISAKNGIGIDEVLEGIVERLPPPQGDPQGLPPPVASSIAVHSALNSAVVAWRSPVDWQLVSIPRPMMQPSGMAGQRSL